MQDLIDNLKHLGYGGLALWRQGPHQYLAAAIDRNGTIAEPRCWHSQPTPEAAIADLAHIMEGKE